MANGTGAETAWIIKSKFLDHAGKHVLIGRVHHSFSGLRFSALAEMEPYAVPMPFMKKLLGVILKYLLKVFYTKIIPQRALICLKKRNFA